MFRYIGTDELYMGWALRCTKLEIVIEDTVKTFKTDILNEIGMPLDTHKYLEEVIKLILPQSSEYLPFAKSIKVTEYFFYYLFKYREFLLELNKITPSYIKQSKDVINTKITDVYLIKDNSCLVIPNQIETELITPQITFEIKPKSCDKFPNSELCQFCCFQYYKYSKNKEKELSKYCPALLYSNKKENIIKSFRCLLETPQNNLTFFIDSKLTKTLSIDVINKEKEIITIEDLIEIYSSILIKTEVLLMIYTLQNMNKLSLEELNNIIINKNKEKKFSEDDIVKLRNFVISKSAKDCTIMITIQIFSDIDDIKLDNDIIRYKDYLVKYRLGIVDLDLKSPELIPLYIKMYEKTSKALVDYGNLKKKCYKKELNL